MASQEGPREAVLHQSLTQPNQLLGGDREMVLSTLLMATVIAFSLGSLAGIVISIIFAAVLLTALKRMGAVDPMMRPVYLRHLRYGQFYPAKSGLYARSRRLPSSWR